MYLLVCFTEYSHYMFASEIFFFCLRNKTVLVQLGHPMMLPHHNFRVYHSHV